MEILVNTHLSHQHQFIYVKAMKILSTSLLTRPGTHTLFFLLLLINEAWIDCSLHSGKPFADFRRSEDEFVSMKGWVSMMTVSWFEFLRSAF